MTTGQLVYPPNEWNDTETDYPKDSCFHQLFEDTVERYPEAVAVVFEEQQLTYRELNHQANQLAHHLRKLGVKPDMLVGICVERSLKMIVGLLGIFKAGGAYLPLDPSYPQERLAFMLSDAQVPFLLTQQHLQASLPSHPSTLIDLDSHWERIAQESEQNPVNQTAPNHLAYCIYTSGSTGEPKGVLLEHRGLCNLAIAQSHIFNVQPSGHILQFASLNFDASISEIVMALISGAVLCLGTQKTLSGRPLLQLLRDQAITVATLPPSVLATLPTEIVDSLQTLIVAGESCSSELVARWASGRRFFNAYGPTETTVCATIAECTDTHQNPPIGHPIVNTQIYVLDRQMQPVSVGTEGELYIGGVSLARGYLNRPKLTEERFVPNPFNENSNTRLYKTGDLVRYRADGQLEFLGRIDHQVKIRGFRIELGEIEAVLHRHPGIQNAMVIDREDIPGDKRLVAYVVYPIAPERIPIYKVCWIEFNNGNRVELATEEISSGGIALLGIPEDCRQGQQVRLRLWWPELFDQWVEGNIAWVQGKRTGIKFDLSSAQQHLLYNAIQHLLKKNGLLETLKNTLIEHLREWLQKFLPDYMIPSHFVVLESLPLTPNGKIDRQALPSPLIPRAEQPSLIKKN